MNKNIYTEWYENGKVKLEIINNTTEKKYFKHGGLKYEKKYKPDNLDPKQIITKKFNKSGRVIQKVNIKIKN